MSLKQRLVASLVAILVLSLLLVGWVGYAQATDALTLSVSDQLRALARDESRQASSEHRRITASLRDLTRTPEITALLSGNGEGASDEARGVAERRVREHPVVDQLLGKGGMLEVRSSTGAMMLSVNGESGDETTGTSVCPDIPETTELHLAVAVSDPEGETSLGSIRFRGPGEILLAGVDVSRLVGTRGWSALLDSERGQPIHLMGCVDRSVLDRIGDGGSASLTQSVRSAGGSLEGFAPRDHDRHVIETSQVEDTELRVIAGASLGEFLVPVQDVGRSYGIFVVVVAIGASILGMLIVNGQLNSLEEVAAAANWIGEDEEAPWMPPPGRDEVGRLSLALNQLADRVDRRMQSAEQVGSMTAIRELTSHLVRDIKNPLSSVRLSLQGIHRDEEGPEVPERWRDTISTSLEELKRVDRVISYVLKAGEQRKTVIAPCSVRQVIHECADLLKVEFERKSVRFRAYLHEGPDRVLADCGRLKNSILQLLQNSVEVLEPGGMLEVTTETTRWSGGDQALVIRIRDDGPGIEPEARDRIFDPFFTTKADAAGIGLAVARRNIREFGGELRRVPLPEVERGVEFSMVLPLTDEGTMISENRGETQ